jgi:hypothetical protein
MCIMAYRVKEFYGHNLEKHTLQLMFIFSLYNSRIAGSNTQNNRSHFAVYCKSHKCS